MEAGIQTASWGVRGRKTLIPDSLPHRHNTELTHAHCKQSRFSCLLQSCCPPWAPQEVVSMMTLEVHCSLPLLWGGAKGRGKGAGCRHREFGGATIISNTL